MALISDVNEIARRVCTVRNAVLRLRVNKIKVDLSLIFLAAWVRLYGLGVPFTVLSMKTRSYKTKLVWLSKARLIQANKSPWSIVMRHG